MEFVENFVYENQNEFDFLDNQFMLFDSDSLSRNVEVYLNFYKKYKYDIDTADFIKEYEREEYLNKKDYGRWELGGIVKISTQNTQKRAEILEKLLNSYHVSNEKIATYFLPFANAIDSYIRYTAITTLNLF